MKGFWFTLEAVLAAIVLVVFLLVITSALSGRTESGDTDVALLGAEALKELDNQGLLREQLTGLQDLDQTAIAMRLDMINNLIAVPGYSHTIRVCTIADVCWGEMPEADNIFVATYFLAGAEQFEPYTVILYLYR